MIRVVALLPLFLVAIGCASTVQPEATTRPAPRPVVVIGGYADPFLVADDVARDLRRQLGDRPVLSVNPGFSRNFDNAAAKVVRATQEAFPSDDPGETVAVDVVGISMGGVTARHAATPRPGERRLKITRLYTIAAPHSGAQLADRLSWADVFLSGRQMRTGSAFLDALTMRERSMPPEQRFPIVQYSYERDRTIGDRGALLPTHLEERGLVVPMTTPFYTTGHAAAVRDGRVRRDIARRLRE